MTRTNLIRALGLYAILATGAWVSLEDSRFRTVTLIVIAGATLKTVSAFGRDPRT